MKARYPFLYLVLASALLAALLLVFNASRESSVLPGPVLSRSKVALIDISGVITSSQGVSRGVTSARSVVLQLENYGEDESVKAVVLRIDSPGGTVVAAQEVYSAIKRLQEERGKVVVASMADIAASGGYYIACAADHIVASPGTLTGSIGVIMEFPNLEGLFGKIGVRTTTIKSGKFKDTGSASRQMTAEERALLQELLDDVHEQFIESVRVSRGLPADEVVALADGRIFTGKQAHRLGLVDETGDLRKAILKAAELAGIEGEPTVLREKKKTRIWDLLESRVMGVLPLLRGGVVPGTGRLLYLWK
jgi:protease-4